MITENVVQLIAVSEKPGAPTRVIRLGRLPRLQFANEDADSFDGASLLAGLLRALGLSKTAAKGLRLRVAVFDPKANPLEDPLAKVGAELDADDAPAKGFNVLAAYGERSACFWATPVRPLTLTRASSRLEQRLLQHVPRRLEQRLRHVPQLLEGREQRGAKSEARSTLLLSRAFRSHGSARHVRAVSVAPSWLVQTPEKCQSCTRRKKPLVKAPSKEKARALALACERAAPPRLRPKKACPS